MENSLFSPSDIDAKLSVELSFVPIFNLALQQNAIPVVYELKLKNNSGRDLKKIESVFSSNPGFILEKTVIVESLQNGEELPIHDLGIEFNYDLLSSLSEAMKGKLKLEISSSDQTLFSKEYDVEAFAADQWLGLRVMPELLASFVTPNLDVVNQLQSIVADELQKATGSSAIQGYQADKTRVYEICSAIYRAIHRWGISYSNPASSFGTPGQRIRFADTIYQYRLGTCLDTTILFASVMEQCGLHPVIMLQSGHAYIGCHLVERYFADIPMDDLQSVRKLAGLDEFLVIETTMVTSGATFSRAETAARTEHLNVDGDFQCAIDVIRARYSGIRPLPLKRSVNGIEFTPVERNASTLGEEHQRHLQAEVDLATLEATSSRYGRVTGWAQKLLDLSLRNRLLNVRDTKQIIPIACTDIALLEDKIAANETISLNPLANLLSEKDLHDLAMRRNSEWKIDIKLLLDKELSQRRLWAPLSPLEVNQRLTALYRQGKTDLEEGGVNTLFLAIAFLEWKVSERDEKSYIAPILLIPISLQRKSIAEGIRIARIDEDTVINETLLELLRTQFQLTIPGIDPLPTDDSGVDINLIMQIFRQTIKDMKGWEVREEARIGHFSFGKFVMWNDMTSRIEELKQNPLVNHLIEGGGIFNDAIEVFDPDEIGQHLDLKNLYCPMSADSSQLAAVLYSQLGKSFVLHGPPGTGKSQTISNIIAHNLALGRRVLFVSEKKAALEVVHKRLSSIGLRPFCLELHSNKSGKTEVLKQFSEALNVPESAISDEWQTLVNSLEQVREELNEYVAELHQRYPNRFSAYDCFSRMLAHSDTLPEDLLKIDCLKQTREDFEKLENLVYYLAIAWSETTKEAVSALRSISSTDWSPVFEKKMLDQTNKFLQALDSLKQSFTAQANAFDIPENYNVNDIYHTALLSEHIKKCENIPAMFLSEDFQEHMAFLKKIAGYVAAHGELLERLHNYHLEIFPDLDIPGISSRIQANNQAFFLIRILKNKALLNELSPMKKLGGTKLTIAELNQLLPDAASYVNVHRELEKNKEKTKELLGKLWNNGEVDWKALSTTFEQTQKIIELINNIAGTDSETKKQLLAKLRSIMPNAKQVFAKASPERNRINLLLKNWNEFQDELQNLARYVEQIQHESDLSVLAEQIGKIVANSSKLRNVLRYRKLRNNADASGLSAFADALEAGLLNTADIPTLFTDAYCQEMLNQIISQSSVLRNFSGMAQDQRVQKFCQLDAKYTAISKRIVFAKLASRLPRRRSVPCPEGTELGMLKRECEKRARQKPVRQLLEQIPTLVAVLKPCFLMSPLSVAQYLPAESAPFDLIVFDEASQIPVCDAIGVIARGKQLIVVGDPKQLPPTNFFQKSESEDVDRLPDQTDDMESILDECIAAGIHPTYLNWHYRSRHEALISFSNHYYYEDRLFTFPSAHNSDRLGIRFEFVPGGIYDRRGTRTNHKEAEQLVKYVFSKLENPNLKQRSIGIVTFSQAQKDLIEDLIERERFKHTKLEIYFSDQNEEPLFVKNLENVQGDERDVILFSICYALDVDGKFSMNFGPLNRQGGERRLNVAITRAKEQVVVFSSIHAQQIDLLRTQALGATHLKYFLDYAEKGFHLQPQKNKEKISEGLTETIADFLNSRGFPLERNVGYSGCRIDLAVRNPDKPSEFLLGIECDGQSYAEQKTARDRDNLRNSVLRSLGWHTYRAWSVDWTFDRKRSEENLLALIEKIHSASEPTPSIPHTMIEKTLEETPIEKNQMSIHSENRKEYQMWIAKEYLSQESFYEIATRNNIREQMCEVIQCEGPIYQKLLKKRIVKAWGFARTGDNIQGVLDACLPTCLEQSQIGENPVFWPRGQAAAEYRDYRVPINEASKRTMDEIPPEEIANAMYEVLIDFTSCEQDTLYRETVKLFGFSAVTTKTRKYLDCAIRVLKESGRVD